MKTHTLRTACVAIAGVGCITWIAFSAPPPIPPSSGSPAGWHWTGEAAICDPPPCIAAWNDRNNWSWLSDPQTAPPPPGYPVNAADDVYMTWSDATPLVVELPLDSRENAPPRRRCGLGSSSQRSIRQCPTHRGGLTTLSRVR